MVNSFLLRVKKWGSGWVFFGFSSRVRKFWPILPCYLFPSKKKKKILFIFAFTQDISFFVLSNYNLIIFKWFGCRIKLIEKYCRWWRDNTIDLWNNFEEEIDKHDEVDTELMEELCCKTNGTLVNINVKESEFNFDQFCDWWMYVFEQSKL